MTANGFWVSWRRDQNVLKFDCVDGCTGSEYKKKNQ